MKHLLTLALCCAALLLGAAEQNLLSNKFSVYGKKNANAETVIRENGQIDCSIKDGKDKATALTGTVRQVKFATPATGTFVFGAESKAENVTGPTPNNYCVYMDIAFTDNTFLYGQKAHFKGGTHDWEKATATVKVTKPVKYISFYLLFRNVSGKASFRAPFLYKK